MDTSIFKAYDIRGMYPRAINDSVVETIGKTCARMFNPGPVVIAHDIRHGSEELSKVLEKSIMNESQKTGMNRQVIAVGLSTTPMFYFLVNHFNAAGGCMITASHNPKEYNGIKIVKEKAETVPGTHILELITTNT